MSLRMTLNPAQLAKYDRDGFLLLADFVDDEACDRLRARAEELVRDFDPRGVVSIFSTYEQTRTSDDYFLESGDKIRFFFEENAFHPDGTLRQSKERSINKIGHALHDLDPVFSRVSRRSAFANLAQTLGFERPLLLQSMYLFKQPHIGAEVGWHQDATYLYTDPITVTGFWVALDDADRNNGCLMALPGAHGGPLRQRFHRIGDALVTETLDPTPWPSIRDW